METQYQHLTMTQHNGFLKLLQIFEELFDGTLGTWKIDPVDFELKEDVKPRFSRLYPVTKVHEKMFKKEVERLFLLGVLEVANDSEWGSPSVAQPKHKSNWVRFISDFSHLNKQLKWKPHPIPKINEMLFKLDVVQYAMWIDLNMVYYYILQVTYVRLFYCGENIDTSVYQWELLTHQSFSNRKWMIYFMNSNSSMRT